MIAEIKKASPSQGVWRDAFDPAAMEHARRLLPQAHLCADALDAARGAHCLIVLTEWNEFRALDLSRMKGLLKRPLMVDLRNIYRPDEMARAGFAYVSIGRPPVGVT